MRSILYSGVFLILLISCGRKDEKYQEFTEERHEPSSEVLNDTAPDRQTVKIKPSDVVVSPLEVSAYLGKYVTVKGYIAQVTKRERIAYLNFVEPFPKNPFTAVIFASRFADFTDIEKYEGKNVEVTGIVSSYKGSAQIVLNDPSQIKILK